MPLTDVISLCRDPTRNTFMVSINVAPDDRVGVMVNYQELLERSQGWYTQKISINPQQVSLVYSVSSTVTARCRPVYASFLKRAGAPFSPW